MEAACKQLFSSIVFLGLLFFLWTHPPLNCSHTQLHSRYGNSLRFGEDMRVHIFERSSVNWNTAGVAAVGGLGGGIALKAYTSTLVLNASNIVGNLVVETGPRYAFA